MVTVWQCNINGDKLDLRVVNPVFIGDFMASKLDSMGNWGNNSSIESSCKELGISLSFVLLAAPQRTKRQDTAVFCQFFDTESSFVAD